MKSTSKRNGLMSGSSMIGGLPDDTWTAPSSTVPWQSSAPFKYKPPRKSTVLLGAKLQPLAKDSVNSQSSRSATSSDSYAVLPHISPTGFNFQRTQAILSGSLVNAADPQPDSVRIYICYNPEDMTAEYDWLWRNAVPQLRQFCNELHVTLELVDVNWQPSAAWYSQSRKAVIADCQKRSLGPDFVLLLGENCGDPLVPVEIHERQYEALSKVISQNNLEGGDGLLNMFSKSDDSKPGRYVLQGNAGAEEMVKLRILVQEAFPFLTQVLPEKDLKAFNQTALEEDAIFGILRHKDSRGRCFCYRRVTQYPDSSDEASSPRRGLFKSSSKLWEALSRNLGSGNSKSYVVGSSRDESYLKKISADFVADMKAMIVRTSGGIFRPASELFVVREVLHHSSLQAAKIAATQADTDGGAHLELLKRIRSFVRDPHRSRRPFVVHGAVGCGKSTAMSLVAAALLDWFTPEGAVVALRFIGSSTDSSDVRGTLSSVAAQIRLAYGLPAVPGGSDTLRAEVVAFRRLLEHVSKQHAHSRPLFVLLDGVEQLKPLNDALEVLWAVSKLPMNVYLFLSTIGGDRANGGTAESSGADVLGALLALVTDVELTFELSSSRTDAGEADREDTAVRALTGGDLTKNLEPLESEFGRDVAALFCAYVATANVGITESELADLLSAHAEVPLSLGVQSTSNYGFALVAELRYRLGSYLEDRLVCGRLGIGWSRRVFRQTVSERYGFVVNDGVREGSANVSAEATNFTLMLHEQLANLHLSPSDRSSLFAPAPSDDTAMHRSTLYSLDPDNALTPYRLSCHMRVLIPLEGLGKIARCVLFNFDWLAARMTSATIYAVLSDVIAIHKLAVDISLPEDSIRDLETLLEFLQLAKGSLVEDPRNLAVEVVSRFSPGTGNNPLVGGLVSQSQLWLDEANGFTSFVALWPVWRRSGDALRHYMEGASHIVGLVEDSEVAVTFDKKAGICAWRLSSGALVHQFNVRSEQPFSGIVVAHGSAFVIVIFYSHVDQNTELNVLSTETGLHLLSLTLPQEVEVVALSSDDHVVCLSTVDPPSSSNTPRRRFIVGVHVLSKDVVFRLPVEEVHSEGIAEIHFVKNIRRESVSILSLGSRSSCDLVLWDLDIMAVDFSVSIGFSVDHFRLSVEEKLAVCFNAESGTLVIVNLSRGSVERRVHHVDYRDASDVAVLSDKVFIATRTGSVVALSIAENVVVGKFLGGSESIPSKLATGSLGEQVLLFVGYEHGDIRVFDTAVESVVGTLSGGHQRRINSLVVLPGGRVISSSDDQRAVLWKYEASLESVEDPLPSARQRVADDIGSAEDSQQHDVGCFALSPDETLIAGGSQSGLISVWNLSTGTLEKQLRCGSERKVDRVYWLLNGQLLLTHSSLKDAPILQAQTAQLWDLRKGEEVKWWEDDLLVYCSKALPTDKHLLTIGPPVDNGNTGLIVAVHALSPVQTISTMQVGILGNIITGTLAVIGFSQKTPKKPSPLTNQTQGARRNTPTTSSRTPLKKPTGSGPMTSSGDGDGLHVLVGYYMQSGVSYLFTFSVVDSSMYTLSMKLKEPVRVDSLGPESCILLPTGGAGICGTTGGTLLRLNVRTLHVEAQYIDTRVKPRVVSAKGRPTCNMAHLGPITCLAVANSGPLFFSGGSDGKIKLWNIATKELVMSLLGHRKPVTRIHLAPNKILVSISQDGTLRVWQGASTSDATYRKRCVFHLHGCPSSVAMTTDRQRVAVALEAEPGGRQVLLLMRSMNL